ncbi:hypothetical protein [Caballeronia sp. RCC_10]|uniref:hypothetical protein n=1 Tax=Caballeronia sp. RCC_10 TaxID=3239227 RepID=UPI003525A138
MPDDLVWRSSDSQTYLSEDVMAHLPANLAEFAAALSIIRRFNARPARLVTGDPNADELLSGAWEWKPAADPRRSR